jgi:hypothetical protein
MIELTEKIVRELLDNEEFVNKCKENLLEILEDKKFDANDVPELINLVVLILEEYDNFEIDEKDIAEVLRVIIVELLEKFNLLDEAKPDLEKMLDSCLKLVILKVKSKTFWNKVLSFFKKCKCC